MGGKLSPLIIVVLIVALVAIGFFAVKLLVTDNSGNKTGDPTGVVDQVDDVKPVITLEKKVNKEGKDIKVEIEVIATLESEEDYVEEIILPDGSKVTGDTVIVTAENIGIFDITAVTAGGNKTRESIEVTEINERSATNPYIPEGFEVTHDVVDEGYTIEDEYGNEFVWIPVPNGKLTRNTMLSTDYEESASTASALVNSVAKYYGFYIGKYEASQYEVDGQVAAATMAGKQPWTNVTYLNAASHANNSGSLFGYTDCTTALLNSYAWDTTVAWIDKSIVNYSSSINYGNYSDTIYPTGYTDTDFVNNICDIAGNVREWTTEIYKSVEEQSNEDKVIHRIVRGGSANLSRTPASHIYYPENTSDNYWGFRVILYK